MRYIESECTLRPAEARWRIRIPAHAGEKAGFEELAHPTLIRAVEPLDLLVLVPAVVVVVDGGEGRVYLGDVIPLPRGRDALGVPVA